MAELWTTVLSEIIAAGILAVLGLGVNYVRKVNQTLQTLCFEMTRTLDTMKALDTRLKIVEGNSKHLKGK